MWRSSLLLALSLGLCAVVSGAAPSSRRPPTSNVARSDYVGAERCASCHANRTPQLHEAFQRSAMRNMTRELPGAVVHAPFAGERFKLGDDVIMMERDGEALHMRLISGGKERRFQITHVIGGRTREDFVGLELGGDGEELIMPVSFVLDPPAWRYKGYSVLVPERDGLRPGPRWRRTCVFCHNTVPYLSTVLDDLHGPGAPVFQGSVSDRFLPEGSLWRPRILDESGLSSALLDEVEHLVGRRPKAGQTLERELKTAIAATRARFSDRAFIDKGIGCEACHNGGREHAEAPRQVRPSFEVKSPWFEMSPPEGAPSPTRAERINRTCVRCHTVLFSRYPFTWEGGRRTHEPGGSPFNSGEARDFLLGGCASQMSCTSCHEPHGGEPPVPLRAHTGPEGRATCVGCHVELASDEAVRAHSRHDPGGPGGACLSCHMANKNLALEPRLTRYHRVGSPTDETRVQRDRPMECALCHAHASVGQLLGAIEQGWGRRYDEPSLSRLYGTARSDNVLVTTLRQGLPHEQAVAAAALGETGALPNEEAAELLVKLLVHEYPRVRLFAGRAIERLLDEPLPMDVSVAQEVHPHLPALVERLKARVEAKPPFWAPTSTGAKESAASEPRRTHPPRDGGPAAERSPPR